MSLWLACLWWARGLSIEDLCYNAAFTKLGNFRQLFKLFLGTDSQKNIQRQCWRLYLCVNYNGDVEHAVN